MYVIYKIVGGFYYYAKVKRAGEVEWMGLIDNATKFSDKQSASIRAQYLNLNQEQIKQV